MTVFGVSGAWPCERPTGAEGAFLLWAVGLGLFMAATGALDTQTVEWIDRIAYWALAVGVGAAVSWLCSRWSTSTSHPLAVVGFRILVLLLPVSVACLFLCIAMFGGEWSISRLSALVPTVAAMLVVLHFPLIYFEDRFGFCSAKGELPAHPPPTSSPLEGFGELLPQELREAELHALEAQDHYVRVHTSRGRALLRMRFREAIVAARAIPGAQTHRSWWVSNSAIARTGRVNGQTVVFLSTGEQIPLSKSHRRRFERGTD
jgi:hypothetical protein